MSVMYKYAGAVAVVAVVAVVGAFALRNGNSSLQLAFPSEITSVGKNAFGSLYSQEAAQETASDSSDGQAVSSPSPTAFGMGVGFGGGGGDVGLDRMIMPPSYELTYRYAGGTFTLSESEIQVLRRVRGGESANSLVSALSRFNLGLMDVQSFANTRMQNVTFAEDREFGYIVSISFEDSSITINENWTRWNNPVNQCQDQACYDSFRLSIGDIPADSELVRIADEFLSSYDIPTNSFGAGEVNNDWRRSYESVPDKSQYYIPEMVTVRYPLIINGQTVYEQGGELAGLNVNVNVRFNRVSGVWGLTSQQYEASNYAAVTDVDRILKFVEQGGFYGPIMYYAENGVVPESREVVLGTPELVLMKNWTYRDNVSNELLVPALRFPIISDPDVPYFYQQDVVVPLAEELLAEREQVNSERPLPIDAEILKSEEVPAE